MLDIEAHTKILDYLCLFCVLWALFVAILAALVMFHHAFLKYGNSSIIPAATMQPLLSEKDPELGFGSNYATFTNDNGKIPALDAEVECGLEGSTMGVYDWRKRPTIYRFLFELICALNAGGVLSCFVLLCLYPLFP